MARFLNVGMRGGIEKPGCGESMLIPFAKASRDLNIHRPSHLPSRGSGLAFGALSGRIVTTTGIDEPGRSRFVVNVWNHRVQRFAE
jgi:hypothetical protein